MAILSQSQIAFVQRWLRRFVSHLSDTDNPHEVTAAQVGAYTKEEIDALRRNGAVAILPGSPTATVDYSVLGLPVAPRYVFFSIEAVSPSTAPFLLGMIVSKTSSEFVVKFQTMPEPDYSYTLYWEVVP